MTRFDPELIAALAEGRLPPEEAAEAERVVSADPAAAAELEAQRAALTALGRLPSATLSDAERTRLRSAVAEAIGLASAPAPAPAPARRRIPWPAVAVAALSLVAVVAIVPQTGLLTTGGDDASTTTFAIAGEAPNETDIAEEHLEAIEPQLAPPSSPEAGSALADDGASTTADGDAVTARSPDPALREILADRELLEASADDSITACRAEAAGVLGSGLDLAAAPLSLEGGGEAVIWFVPGGGEASPVAALSTPGCELLFADG